MTHLKYLSRLIKAFHTQSIRLFSRKERPFTSEWLSNRQRNMGFRGRVTQTSDGRFLAVVDRQRSYLARGYVAVQGQLERDFAQVGVFNGYRAAFHAALNHATELATLRYRYTG